MRAGVGLLFVAAVAMGASGCQADDTTTPPDSGGGLSIEWNSRPTTIPSQPSSDVTIDRVVLRLDDLRVVGDAGIFPVDREWLEWSRGIVPTPAPVMGALPGLYSRLLFELDGDTDDGEIKYAYEIIGTVKVTDSFRPFTIRDTSDLNLSFDFSIMLPAGDSAVIPVRVEIDKIVNVVNFGSVPMQDGRYLLDGSSSQISTVRDAVKDAISINGP
jgi:hypothetical protein